MAENGGYAKPEVLVTTEWVAANAGGIVVAEVDEDPNLYGEGHMPGAVALHWKDELQDQVERDVIDRAGFEALIGRQGIANETTVVLYGDKNNWFAAYAYWYLKLYGHADVRIMDGGRQKWLDEGRDLTTDVPSPAPATYRAQELDESLRARREHILEILATGSDHLVDVRSPQEYSGELIAMPGYQQEGAQRGGHMPGRRVHPLGAGGARRRHVQAGGRAARALRREGRRRLEAHDRLLPHRRALEPHLVRAARAARLQGRAQLRRLVDGVGQPRRRADREVGLGFSARSRARRRREAPRLRSRCGRIPPG